MQCSACQHEVSPGARFCAQCGHSLAAKVPPDTARDAPATAQTGDRGERRQLTAVFCDLVGSTALFQRLDPEELREVVSGFQQACSAAVKEFEGHVAQFLGDGVLVYFGFPHAHEDDAERAVRAALRLQALLCALGDAALALPISARQSSRA